MEMFDLWGQVGAYVRLDPPTDRVAVKALVGSAGIGRDDARVQACLHIDGDRLRAEVGDVVVGWVPNDIARDYLSVFRSMMELGRTPRMTARVQVHDSYEACGGDADEDADGTRRP